MVQLLPKSELGFYRVQLTPVLFQTGYLTLKGRDEYGLYRLDYPNHEVQASMTLYLMAEWAHEEPARTTPMVVKLHKAFLANDMTAVIEIIKTVGTKNDVTLSANS